MTLGQCIGPYTKVHVEYTDTFNEVHLIQQNLNEAV